MISVPDRQGALTLINEAIGSGARNRAVRAKIGITRRTGVRGQGQRRSPPSRRATLSVNRFSPAERTQVLQVANLARFSSLPPTQIVPILTDEER